MLSVLEALGFTSPMYSKRYAQILEWSKKLAKLKQWNILHWLKEVFMAIGLFSIGVLIYKKFNHIIKL